MNTFSKIICSFTLLALFVIGVHTVYADPVANFTWDINEPDVQAGEEVEFYFTGVIDEGREWTAFTWIIDGDADNAIGGTADDSIIEYIFRQAGEHTVKLIALDDEGEIGSITKSVTVTPADLSVSFTFTPDPPFAVGQAVDLNASVDYIGNVNNLIYNWSIFEGGERIDGIARRVTSYTFGDAGEYTVVLEVLDPETGTEDSFERTATVGSDGGAAEEENTGTEREEIPGRTYDANTDYGKGGLVPCDGINCDFNKFIELLNRVIEWIFYTAAVVATVMFAYAGWLYMSSGGSPQKISTAHNIFKKTAIGLIIIALAWLIVNTITSTLLDTENGFWTILQ